MPNNGLPIAVSQRIEVMRKLSPQMADAFLTGLEAGYTLGLCQGEEKKEGSDK